MGKPKRTAKPKRKLRAYLVRIESLTFYYGILATLAQLDSWATVLQLLQEQAAEIANIVQFFGRIINFLLGPWRFVRDIIFNYVPFQVPTAWKDPLLLGSFVWLFPFHIARAALGGILSAARESLISDLNEATQNARTNNDRAHAADKLEEAAKIATGLYPAIHNVQTALRGLRDEMFPREIINNRLDVIDTDIARIEHTLKANEKSDLDDITKDIVHALAVGAATIVLLVLISFDKIFSESAYSALDVLWRTPVVMITGGIVCLLLFLIMCIAVLFLGLILWGLTELIRVIPPFSQHIDSLYDWWARVYYKAYTESVADAGEGTPRDPNLLHPESYNSVELVFGSDNNTCYAIHDTDINYFLVERLEFDPATAQLQAISTWGHKIMIDVNNKHALTHLTPNMVMQLCFRFKGEIVDRCVVKLQCTEHTNSLSSA